LTNVCRSSGSGAANPKRVVNEHLLILYAPLRHFHYALGNHFPHHPRIRWARESTARFLNLARRNDLEDGLASSRGRGEQIINGAYRLLLPLSAQV